MNLFRCLTTSFIPSRSNDGDVKPYSLLKVFHVCRHTNLPPCHPAEKRILLQSVLSCYSCKLEKPPPLGSIHNNRLVWTYFKCCGFFPFSAALFLELGKDSWMPLELPQTGQFYFCKSVVARILHVCSKKSVSYTHLTLPTKLEV